MVVDLLGHMRTQRKICSVVFLIFIGVLTTLPATATDRWVRIKSQNFELVGNASESQIEDVAAKLEQFRVVFGSLFTNLKLASPVPTTVIVFKNEAAFDPYRSSKWAGGYFLSSEDKNYIALPVGDDREETYSIIFHEYVHFLVINNFGREKIAPWFNEGIAEYYDKFQIRDEQTFTIGGVSRRHLATLKTNPIIPFEKFFSITHEDVQRQGDHGASVFYAQSWAFIHFLIQSSNGKRAPQFNKFMSLSLNGEESGSAFKKAFQTDYSVLENEFRLYLSKPEQMTHTILRFNEKLKVERDFNTSQISEASSKAYLGDLLYRSGQRGRAESELSASLRLDKGNGLANATLGLIRIHQNRLPDARVFLERAVKSNPNDYSVYYYYAYALSRKGGYSADIAKKIKDSVLRSISLNPEFAPSYDLIANVSLEMNSDLDEGIDYAKKGIKLAPGDQGFALNLANLYIRKGDFMSAAPIVNSVLRTATQPEIKSYAKDLEKSIADLMKLKMDSATDTYAAADEDGPPVKLARRDSGRGMTKEEYERRKREVEIRGINDSLRKLNPGEARTIGFLSGISCKNGLIRYSVKTSKGIAVFESKGFKGIEFKTFNVDTGDLQIGCNMVKKPVFGVVVYRVVKNSSIAGELITIEFVPEYFRLAQE